MKLSKHSKKRMRQRTNFNHKERAVLFKNALIYGKSYGEIRDGKLKDFLKSKESWKSKAKVYKDYVFIHSRNSKQLYTMYELPDEYKVKE